MLFVIIPVTLIVAAVLVLTVVVLRKWPYLKKLEPGAHEVGDSFLHDLAPEAIDGVRKISWRDAWHNTLVGLEEFLDKFRTLFTNIERASARMVRSVRRSHESAQRKQEHEQQKQEQRAQEQPKPVVVPEEDDAAALKQREQQLIVDIAQNPKNSKLYRELSRIYVKLGNLGDAVESLKAASKLEPDNGSLKSDVESLKERYERAKEKEKKEED